MFNFFGKKPKPTGPDFSRADSVEKVLELERRGEVERVWLLPELFGGEDVRENVVFVPAGCAAEKVRVDENIAPMAAEGRITRYTAEPRYAGRSHIPVAIVVTASEPGHFVAEIRLWGEGLTGRP